MSRTDNEIALETLTRLNKTDALKDNPSPVTALANVALDQATILALGVVKTGCETGHKCACCLKRGG